jgi:hypothetical protein
LSLGQSSRRKRSAQAASGVVFNFGPASGSRKLHYQDGSEAGDAAYADNVNPGDELMLGLGRFVRVLEVVPVEDVDDSPYTALLQVEAVQ